MLSQTESKFHFHGEPTETAYQDFIVDMMPYVRFVAQRISTNLPPSVELEDLVHYGVLGLIDAMKKFDSDKGVKFKTYAETRIRGAILDGIRSTDWIPRSIRRKRRELEAVMQEIEHKTGEPPDDEEIASAMGVSVKEFQCMLNEVKGPSIGSFEELVAARGEDRLDPMIRYFPDPDSMNPHFTFERKEIRRLLAGAIEKLPEKEKLVLSLYYYDELSMKEIGKVLGISESRVSQLHTKALIRIGGKLRRVLNVA